FGFSTLADGWADGKEKDNGCIILLRDNQYYLGVFNKNNKPDFSDKSRATGESCYRKMIYRQFPNPVMGLPNLMVIDGVTVRRTTNLEELKNKHLPPEINEIRKKESYSKGPTFNKEELAKWIEYYADRIREYYKQKMKYEFKSPGEYESWVDFCNDVKWQSYQISFDDISEQTINKMIEDNQLFLFRIYNKDFSEHTKGRPNLHTLYWKKLFSPENLQKPCIKLSGEAELFYREADEMTKNSPTKHEKGSVLVNRQTKCGETIPAEIYPELCKFFNGRKGEAELSEAERSWKSQAVTKKAKFEIVKDRRYAKPMFLFHVPIELNFQPEPNGKKVLDILKEQEQKQEQDYTILGIDRGERNLIYITLIDHKGNILLQKSLNSISAVRYDKTKVPVDYQKKLDSREKERGESRKSWKEIGTIKELKEGYLSQVVHEIAGIIVEHKAVVAMEDLNSGFKRGRFSIEKQVYQKFEKALIDKLNYLVFKDRDDSAPGGVLRGYQLTPKFKSFTKLPKQNGIIFYVPPQYTSKIDPTTGFIDFLHPHYDSREKSRKFFKEKFERICYSVENDYFEFVSEDPLKDRSEDSLKYRWTICTFGELRWAAAKKSGHWEVRKVDVTRELKALFEKHGIAWQKGDDLKEDICRQDEAEFFKTLIF
ncbi:MAG: type V CRISPR-associated protein Cas12a/Cpf1, partial [Thermoguttaceae bacterium]|nr:type V CRISPR-associated protein Cas12a/Cpf1 [Thermoguttaceae bacterium]